MDAASLAPLRERFLADGFVQFDGLLQPGEVAELAALYDRFTDGTLDVARHRYDLGASDAGEAPAPVERITQIMWPSDVVPALREHVMRSRALALVRALYSDPAFEFDFDMLICKAPHSATPTPPHQDAAYWCSLDDRRAVSVWVALDASTLDNGCMWYGARTHLAPLRAHRKAGSAATAALQCDADESEMVPMPLAPGGAGLHAGGTLHYSRGNTTAGTRRAYIMNFRPRAAIEQERAQGFDHGRGGNSSTAVRGAPAMPAEAAAAAPVPPSA